MPNNTVSAAVSGLAYDNRSSRTRFFDDIQSLARMASITYKMIEDAHCFTRAVKHVDNIYTFNFSETWLDDINFAVADLMERAASLAARREAYSGEEE